MRLVSLATGTLMVVLLAGCGPGGGGDKVKRGAYLTAVGACGDCHTPGTLLGKPEMDKVFSGGNVGFEVPELGVFYPPNLTPDEETGLGKWSEAEIAKAVREGVRPDGRQIAPVMPYGWYGKMSEEDGLAIAAYLKSLTPRVNKVPGPFGSGQAATAPYQTVVFPKADAPSAAPAVPPSTPQ